MKFLVILFCLLSNYLWLKDLDRFDDGWFFVLRRQTETLLKALKLAPPAHWIVSLVLIYALPLGVVAALLLILQGVAFGLPTMALHILLLLVALDRTQPGQLASEFLQRWNRGEVESCMAWLAENLRVPEAVQLHGPEALGRYFRKQFAYRCFERMFVMFFWYILAGPLGVLFSYITYQLRDSHGSDQDVEEVEWVARILAVLEWAPLRLLGLTFCLAGNFVQCFERVQESFWTFRPKMDTSETLYAYANCALSGMIREQSLAVAGDGEVTAPREDSEAAQQRRYFAAEIRAMQALLERSQAIWLALLALVTIFALP